ncbi:hypothetical protein [Pedobacter cryotolerans]|uniref:Uncharacterized protein n=1 Tax=Pedobacter cryotolerans TaxID=2571270 RepID=A0A4U1CAU7_9SPHI|nr:hypothetical protein [Pedobacter cryotolerans]TKC03156.1 hypothetical protein FA045_00885 [Pedobacter cryotolerans]
MQQPFDLEIGPINYAIFPEGNDTYVVFKDGSEYAHIQKDTAEQWLKLDSVTDLPKFDFDEEINQIGKLITEYLENPPIDEDEEEEE